MPTTFTYIILPNYQLDALSDSTGRVYERSQTIHFVVNDQSSPSRWIIERNTTSPRLIVCLKKNSHCRFRLLVLRCFFCGSRILTTAKVSERTNSSLTAGNRLVQLLALQTDQKSHNARRYRQTDGPFDDDNSRKRHGLLFWVTV